MIINTERYIENLKKRCDAIRKLHNDSDEQLKTSIEKRNGCSLYAEAAKEIDETYERVNKCRLSKGLPPLQNVLEKHQI